MRTHSSFTAAIVLVAAAAASLALVACGGAPDSASHTSTVSSPATRGSPVCTTTLSDWCSKSDCLTTWSAADTVCMNAPGDGTVQMSFSCGSSFFALSRPASTSYYDSQDSGLVAVFDANGACLGGPAGFTAPASDACMMTSCGGGASCGGPPGSM